MLLYQFAVGDFRKPIASGWEQVADALLREDIARATDGNPARRLATVAALAQSLRALGERHVERERQQNAQARAQAAERALERMRSRRPWVYAATALLAQGQPAAAAELAATLNPDALQAGSPGEPWAARLRGLHGVIELQLGQKQNSPLSLQAALEELEAGEQADFYAALLRAAMRKTGKEAMLEPARIARRMSVRHQ